MNNGFDFDKIGKRTPYTTPEGFFSNLEEDIWKEVKTDFQAEENNNAVEAKKQSEARKITKRQILMRSIMAVAAAVVLALVVNVSFAKSDEASIEDVDQAFCQLTTEDQAYLLSVYQDDVFINE